MHCNALAICHPFFGVIAMPPSDKKFGPCQPFVLHDDEEECLLGCELNDLEKACGAHGVMKVLRRVFAGMRPRPASFE